VIFDESLNFIPHARDAAAEGMKVLGKICFLRHRGKGISCHAANHLVFAAILPKMLWASSILRIGSPNIISTLKTTYNAAARWITGLPANTDTKATNLCKSSTLRNISGLSLNKICDPVIIPPYESPTLQQT
jgi:hypothetical protein